MRGGMLRENVQVCLVQIKPITTFSVRVIVDVDVLPKAFKISQGDVSGQHAKPHWCSDDISSTPASAADTAESASRCAVTIEMIW